MSSQYASVLIVRESDLPETPAAFQQYVAEFFARKEILGTSCLYAFEVLSFHGYDGHTKGAAPSHSVDRSRFKDGLGHGQDLGGWIQQAAKKGLITKFGAGWDDGLRVDVD
ncbi:MAG: hypothetical protein E6P95_01995 [Candidatus Moraniibacteriota bacterium]|nr:MAG: hypothetical protein E6P95_01995 [Candidatus Moranbacteria bacterium]